MQLDDLQNLFTKAEEVGEVDKTRRKQLVMHLHSIGDLSDGDVEYLFDLYQLGES